MGINFILTGISAIAVSLFGIYYKLQTFVYMPTSGITQGAMPIMGYNYGAGNRKRLLETLNYSMIICAAINLAGTFIFWVFPREILLLFKASDEMMTLGISALKIISISFIFGSICFIFACFLQAIGKGMASLVITLLRQLIIILPAAFVMGKLWGLNGVWASFIAAEFLTCIFSLIIFKYYSKKDNILQK